MKITLSMSIMDGDEPLIQQDIIHLSKPFHPDELIGLSLDESKQLLNSKPVSSSSHRNGARAARKNDDSRSIGISITRHSP